MFFPEEEIDDIIKQKEKKYKVLDKKKKNKAKQYMVHVSEAISDMYKRNNNITKQKEDYINILKENVRDAPFTLRYLDKIGLKKKNSKKKKND